jgi:hypothetical protein
MILICYSYLSDILIRMSLYILVCGREEAGGVMSVTCYIIYIGMQLGNSPVIWHF